MNKFNVTIGILILLLCLAISTMALMSAFSKNESANNIIYVDNGSTYSLNIPKSNLISEQINIKKDIIGEKSVLSIDVRLPKINIQTDVVQNINKEIYTIYQELYNYALSLEKDEKIRVDYTYDYIEDKNQIALIIKETKEIDGKNTVSEKTYIYDFKKDAKI